LCFPSVCLCACSLATSPDDLTDVRASLLLCVLSSPLVSSPLRA
jgi:hypothetical protein